MNANEIITNAFLQGANAVHDGVDSGKKPTPSVRRRQRGEIRGHPARIRKSALRLMNAASSPDEIVAFGMQFREAS